MNARTSRARRSLILLASLGLACVAGCSKSPPPPGGPREFASPDAAAQALYRAARDNSAEEALAIFGEPAREFLLTGDPATDAAASKSFADAYDQMHRFGKLRNGGRVLIVGLKNYPFPFPLRKGGAGTWHFDTEGGRAEFLARRIGDNELDVMDVLTAMADAQAEYFSAVREGSVQQYAQKLASSPSRQDGLYWPVKEGEPESPLGPLIAQATREGPGGATVAPTPFHGYLFRILTEQGEHAIGGARSFVADGHMTGGFAFLAYPAEYRRTGVMTFLIGPEGRIFQKDLGPETAQVAEATRSFDTDPSWLPVEQ